MLRRMLKVFGVVLIAAVLLGGGALAWLSATAPQPRDAAGWSLMAPLPSARGELATAVAHAEPCPAPPCPQAERLLVLGGLAGLLTTEDRVDIYDPGEQRWTTGPPLPEPRHHLAAVGLDRAVYVSGGAATLLRFPWRPTSDLWRLDLATARWDRMEPMPEPRWGHRMVLHDGRLYVIGGHGPSARVLIYTPDQGWTTGAEMPVQRDHLSVVVAAGTIWAIGGRADGSLARVDIYDPDADSWEPGPDLPAPTSGAAEGVIEGVVLILGGEAPELFGEVYDRHWQLDTTEASPQWRTVPIPPLAVHGADGAVFQGAMVIAGGASRHGVLSVTAWTTAVQRLEAPVGE
jgi:hypothetical protein